MSDTAKALEEAAIAVARTFHCDAEPPPTDVDRLYARAAVLAFLRAMPDALYDAPIGYRLNIPTRMIAAIEGETKP